MVLKLVWLSSIFGLRVVVEVFDRSNIIGVLLFVILLVIFVNFWIFSFFMGSRLGEVTLNGNSVI